MVSAGHVMYKTTNPHTNPITAQTTKSPRCWDRSLIQTRADRQLPVQNNLSPTPAYIHCKTSFS